MPLLDPNLKWKYFLGLTFSLSFSLNTIMSLSFLRELGNVFHTFVKCGKKNCVNLRFAVGNKTYPFTDLVELKI